MKHTNTAATLLDYQAFAEALARWNGDNDADRRELLDLFERLTAAPQSDLFERFVAAPLLQAACSEAAAAQC